MRHSIPVYKTPWGLCALVEDLIPCTRGSTKDEILTLAGNQAHSGWYEGSMRDFIELSAIQSDDAELDLWRYG